MHSLGTLPFYTGTGAQYPWLPGYDNPTGRELYSLGNGVNLRTGPGTIYPSHRKASKGALLGRVTNTAKGSDGADWYEFETLENYISPGAKKIRLWVSSRYAGFTRPNGTSPTENRKPKPENSPGTGQPPETKQAGTGKLAGLALLAVALGLALR